MNINRKAVLAAVTVMPMRSLMASVALAGALAGLAIPDTASASIIALYEFDNNLNDSSGNNNNGSVLSGSPSFSSSHPSGGNSTSLQLGSSDSVIFGYEFPFQTLTNATLQFWVNPTGSGEHDIFWTTNASGDTNRFNIGLGPTAVPFIDYRDPSGDLHLSLGASVAIPDNTWTLIDYVKQADVYSIYINGVLEGQKTNSSTLPDSTGWTINGRGTENSTCCQFTGLLNDVELFNTAITPTPLPSAWTMLIAGFVGLGLSAYRGTKKMAAPVPA